MKAIIVDRLVILCSLSLIGSVSMKVNSRWLKVSILAASETRSLILIADSLPLIADYLPLIAYSPPIYLH